MSIYDSLQATAMSLLTRYGRPKGVTLLQAGPASYDPATGKNSPTTTTYIGTGVLIDYSLTQPSVSTVRGTEIQQGDKLLYLGMQGTLNGVPVQMPQPNTDDTIVVAGTSYNVEATTTIDPAGTPVIHTMHLRGVPGVP
jgi:hypothetical protein